MNDQQRAAMQMALEALEWYADRKDLLVGTFKAIEALRETLAQPQDMKECRHCGWLCKPNDAPSKKGYVLAQPQGEWVDLTDDEELEIASSDKTRHYIVCEVIAKFKSKNTPPVVPQGEPVAWVVYDSEANDIVWTEEGKKLKAETPLYTTPPSVEAMRIETLEKAAKVCEKEMQAWINFDEDCHEASAIKKCAAAIRSMK